MGIEFPDKPSGHIAIVRVVSDLTPDEVAEIIERKLREVLVFLEVSVEGFMS